MGGEIVPSMGCHDRGTHRDADLGLWRLMDAGQRSGSLHGTDLGSFHVCDNHVTWSICKVILTLRGGPLPAI